MDFFHLQGQLEPIPENVWNASAQTDKNAMAVAAMRQAISLKRIADTFDFFREQHIKDKAVEGLTGRNRK